MSFEVIDGGFETGIQDYPGRIGYYNVGIPPSGPADSFAFRIANLLVKEPIGRTGENGSAGIEATIKGPQIKFREKTVIAITGAEMSPKLNDKPVPMWQTTSVKEGDVLSFGVSKSGCRAYIAIAGGIDVPITYGSRSIYKYGNLGGYNGELLKKGHVVKAGKPKATLKELEGRKLDPHIIPRYPNTDGGWQIGLMLGPQDDYYENETLELFANEKFEWKVNPQSDRMGIRLIGPLFKYKPPAQRPPSQDPLAHPSNIPGCHGYAIGTINVAGDTPIIIFVDGVSLGGYCCIATITTAELWKAGQLKGKDSVRFRDISLEEARKAFCSLEDTINERSIITT